MVPKTVAFSPKTKSLKAIVLDALEVQDVGITVGYVPWPQF